MKKKVKYYGKKSLKQRLISNRSVYIFLLPGFSFLLLFHYLPIGGIVLAFKEYKINMGIFKSPWVNPWYKNFVALMDDTQFVKAFFNTFRMGFGYILSSIPVAIIVALLLNELRSNRYKKVLQVFYTFPNFLSWVAISGLLVSFFSTEGLVNGILGQMGIEKIGFLTSNGLIRPILYISNVWKGAGWSAIIYLAAISGIDPALYDAACIDGANRFQCMRHITWPGIKMTVVIVIVMAFGNITNNGFDQILNMTNAVVRQSAEVLDTYIYTKAFQASANYGVATAMGLTKSIINFAFLLTANKIAKILNGEAIL